MESSRTDAPKPPRAPAGATLAATTERGGRVCRAAQNRPLALDRPDLCYYVVSGTVDVFAARLDERRNASGRRTHLATFRDGAVMFGSDLASPEDPGLLAVGRMSAELRAVPLAVIEATPAVHAEFAAAVERWIGDISAAAASMVVPRPAIDERLDLEATPRSRPNRRVSVAGGVFWLSGLRGASFLDVADVGGDAAAFPLHYSAWLHVPEAVRGVSAKRTIAALADSTWRAGLARFHRAARESIGTHHALRLVDEYNVITDRDRMDARRMRTTLRRAAQASTGRAVASGPAEHDDPLLQAVAQLARRLSGGRPALDASDASLPAALRLARLASSARLRLREVNLPHRWWRRKGHAYLGWTADDAPRALTPAGRSGYRMYDPASDDWRAVDAEAAKRIRRRAWAVYGSMTASRVSGRNLIEFALRGGAGDVLAIACFGLAAVAAGLAAPVAVGTLVGAAIPHAERALVLELALALGAAGVASSAFFFLTGMASVRLQSIAEAQAQGGLMDRFLRLPARFFQPIPAADLARRVLGVSLVRRILARGAVTSVIGGLFTLTSLAVMSWFSPRLTLYAVGGLTAVGAILTAGNLLRLRFEKRVLHNEGKSSGMAYQFIRAMAKVRVAGAEVRVFSLWMERHVRQRRWMYLSRLVENAIMTGIVVLPPALSMLFFGFAATNPALPRADFVAFLTAFSTFVVGFTALARESTLALPAIAHFDRARPILRTSPETPTRAHISGPLAGRVEIDHVTFGYQRNAPPALRDVSISAAPGQFLAVTGPSGSGKSTLLRLLLGFEQPDSGAIFYDGQDLGRIDIGSVRRQLGVVLQNGRLFPGSIFENIAGVEQVGHDEAWEAAAAAGIADEIRAMPMGMFTYVSDDGVLSGGQRQRLMIARALLRRPRILLLDEATSALDNRTQFEVARNIERLNMTRIVIAHRLSTIQMADLICVLDDRGCLVEQGRHDDLMAADGLFARIARRQTL